jgi:hypothetical protein
MSREDDDLCVYYECLSPDRGECEQLKQAACTCDCHDETEIPTEEEVIQQLAEEEEREIEQARAMEEGGGKVRIYALHPTDPDKLEEITEKVKELGEPRIQVVHIGADIFALEGSHRLAAASKLGLKPILCSLPLEAALATDIEVISANGVPLHLTSIGEISSFLNALTFFDFLEPVEGAHIDDSPYH